MFFLFDRKQEQKQVVKNKGETRLSQKDMLQISEGDIILRRGYGFFSDFVIAPWWVAYWLGDVLVDAIEFALRRVIKAKYF